jgi:5,10-methylenetetrahydromethanopterin reductase
MSSTSTRVGPQSGAPDQPSTVALPEVAYYALPGHVASPAQVVEEVQLGEQMGLGSVWISERLNTKNVEVLSGVASAHAPTMGIASGLISNLPLRNPLVTASYASTMQLLTDNRFALGFGRGQDPLSDAAGVPRLTFQVLEDSIRVLRALWDGESVNYSGPLGTFKDLSLSLKLEKRPPIMMAVMGDKTCEWAGRHCDAVIYNSMWSPQAIAHSTQLVRKGAAAAGRDPDSVRIWTILITACELPEEEMLTFVVRRMNTYLAFPVMYRAICEANGWDPAVLDRVRALQAEIDGRAAGVGGTFGDEHMSRRIDDLRRSYDVYPREWIEQGCAVGSREYCARRIQECLDAGAHGVLLHGSTPKYLGPLIEQWRRVRPAARFAHLPRNPGLMA